MTEKPLYQDDRFKVEILESSPEDHVLYMKTKSGEEHNLVLQRGVLEELAKTPQEGIGEKINACSSEFMHLLKQERIGLYKLYIVLHQAYIEQEARFNASA